MIRIASVYIFSIYIYCVYLIQLKLAACFVMRFIRFKSDCRCERFSGLNDIMKIAMFFVNRANVEYLSVCLSIIDVNSPALMHFSRIYVFTCLCVWDFHEFSMKTGIVCSLNDDTIHISKPDKNETRVKKHT